LILNEFGGESAADRADHILSTRDFPIGGQNRRWKDWDSSHLPSHLTDTFC
jgi:hypothetical protein